MPKYDVREIAEYLSKKFNIITIFLSTTMDSYLWFNAYHQKIERIDLPGKINKILQTNGRYKAWRKISAPNITIDEIQDPSVIFQRKSSMIYVRILKREFKVLLLLIGEGTQDTSSVNVVKKICVKSAVLLYLFSNQTI